MGSIKEIFDAFNQRLKSPIFGSIVIAYVFLNWQPIFILLFSKDKAQERLIYFSENTSFWSLAVLPILIGTFLALLAPWVSFLGAKWAEKPQREKRLLTVQSAYEVEKLRNKLREESSKAIDNVISSAKQDLEVDKIDDEGVRDKVKKEVENIRLQSSPLIQTTETNPKNENFFRLKLIDRLEKEAEEAKNDRDFKEYEEKKREIHKLIREGMLAEEQGVKFLS